MRLFISVLLLMCALDVGSVGSRLAGAPVQGARSLNWKNETEISLKEAFRGGERACVIANAGTPKDNLVIEVFDEKDRLVARVEESGSLVAAIWYPPRDAVYRIKISSPEGNAKKIYVSLK